MKQGGWLEESLRKAVVNEEADAGIERLEQAFSACHELVETIEALGGAARYGDEFGVAVDPCWVDLGQAYMTACRALGKEPRVAS